MKVVDCKIAYYTGRVIVLPRAYPNNRLGLELIEVGSHEPIAVATVNLPDAPLGPDEIYVKDYSENEGMVQFLLDAGIISGEPTGHYASGFVVIPRYRLSEDFQKELHQ